MRNLRCGFWEKNQFNQVNLMRPQNLRAGHKFWDLQPARKLLMSSPHQQLDCQLF